VARMGPDSRTALIAWAEAAPDPVPKDKRGEAFSTDANLLHTRRKARCWKTRGREALTMCTRARSTRRTPRRPEYIEIAISGGATALP
jgi:argininosuccinate synthase